MPQYSPPRPNTPLPPQRRPPAPYQPRPSGPQARPRAGARPSAAPVGDIRTAPTTDPPKSPDLTLNKIIAGAGAAATSAVVGSFFGAAGTVLGAALGSVVSTLATAIYQHSLDRTRDRVKVRIKLPVRRTVNAAGQVEVSALQVAAGGETGRARVSGRPAGSANRPTVMLSPVVPARPRRRWAALTAITAGVFLIGLLAVTGVELLKGSTLTRGDSGTSVGRVVDPAPAPADTTEPTGTESSATTETAEPAETSTTPATEPGAEVTATRSATDEPDGDTGRGADIPEDSSAGDDTDPGTTPATTPTPTSAANGD